MKEKYKIINNLSVSESLLNFVNNELLTRTKIKKENFSIERVSGIKFLRKIRKAQLINEFLKENKVEGIVADHWKSLELIKTDKKKYCLIHGKEINHARGSSLNKRVNKILNSAEKVIANSEYTKNLSIQSGVEQEKVVVINPGINPAQELNKTSLSKVESLLKTKSPRLITVSRFDKRKNHEKIIMALRNLKQLYPDIVYICIGYGDEEGNIKKLVEEFINFISEITLLTIRQSNSSTIFCPPIGHQQEQGDYIESWQPENINQNLLKKVIFWTQKVK